MTTCTLLPARKRLKELIAHHGASWVVLQERSVQCLKGPGVLIESRDGAHRRWVYPHEITKDGVQ